MLHPRTLLDEPIARVALRGRLLAPWRRRRFHRFGPNSVVHRPLAIYGPWQMDLGEGVLVLHGAWLSVEKAAWDRPAPVLRIGDRVGIRPYCTISAAESITIEDDVILSAYSTVIDCDHTVAPGVANVLHTPLATTPVHIGAGTWIGERCSILRGARIGKGCIIGAGSVVRGQIPDHSVAVGAPARVVKSLPQQQG